MKHTPSLLPSVPCIGVLALQGAYDVHAHRLTALGATASLVRTPAHLENLDALVIPGGESTTFLKHLERANFYDALNTFVHHKPTFGTCAGCILLAQTVLNPPQKSFAVLDITVERNAYGRQNDSAIICAETTLPGGPLEMVFHPRPPHHPHRRPSPNPRHPRRLPYPHPPGSLSRRHLPPGAHRRLPRPPALPRHRPRSQALAPPPLCHPTEGSLHPASRSGGTCSTVRAQSCRKTPLLPFYAPHSTLYTLSMPSAADRFWHLPADASLHGPSLDAHLLLNLWIALALLALAHILLFLGIAKKRQADRPHQTLLIEYLPLAALTLLFAFLAIRANHLWAAQRYTGADPSALQVEVTGMQFAWYFRYPGHDQLFGHTKPSLIDPSAANPPRPRPHRSRLRRRPRHPPSSSSPPTAKSTSPSSRRMSSTASPFPSSASSKTPFPASPSTSTSPPPPPATTPSSAPSSAAWATTA